MLEANRKRVQHLTGLEIWMFIVGRSLMAFGLGVLAMTYFPDVSSPMALPAFVLGLAILIVASRGLFRNQSNDKAV